MTTTYTHIPPLRPAWFARLLAYKTPLLLVVAVVLRLGLLVGVPSLFAFDQTGVVHGSAAYDTYAQNLLTRGEFSGDILPGEPDAYAPPGYPYTLAALYTLFGRSYLTVGIFHSLLDALSIWLVIQIGRRLLPRYGDWVGWLGGAMFAFYPYLIFQNLTLIDTPLFMTLSFAFVWLMIRLRDAQTHRTALVYGIVGGVVLGLAGLTRSTALPFAGLVALWFLFRLNLWTTLRRLLPVAVLSVMVIAPWIIRSSNLYGQFVFINTNGGANFYQGNNANTVPYLRAGYDVQWLPTIGVDDLTILEQVGPVGNARMFNLGLEYLRQNPEAVPELLWVKFLTHWSIDISPRLNPTSGDVVIADYAGTVATEAGTDSLNLSGVPADDPVNAYSSPVFEFGRLVHRFYFGGLLLLAVVGVLLTAKHWREVSLLWLVQVFTTVVYVAFHPSTRYRAPTDPLLFLFSAYALVWVWHRLAARRRSIANRSNKAEAYS